MIRSVALFLGLLAPSVAWPCEVESARATLGKWGLSYCVNEYVDDAAPKAQAGYARGGYFQLGRHNSEDAYKNVEKYVDEKIGSQSNQGKDGIPMYFSGCLDVYASEGYRLMIEQQDRYLGEQAVN